jgi:uroporphyrinogen-III synthase
VTGDEADRKRAAAALRGVRVAVTRPLAASDGFAAALAAAGAVVLRTPTIRIEPVGDEIMLRNAVAGSDGYDWIAFTSATGVARFCELGGRAATRIAAVGPVTATAAHAAGLRVHALPEEYRADEIVAAMTRAGGIVGARVLWPRAEGARRALAVALAAAGATVDELVLYRTVEDLAAGRQLETAVERGQVDVLTFTSPSAVRAYARGRRNRGAGVTVGVTVAVIGPVTAAEARRHGLPVHVEPAEHTTAAMVASLRAFYEVAGGAGTEG